MVIFSLDLFGNPLNCHSGASRNLAQKASSLDSGFHRNDSVSEQVFCVLRVFVVHPFYHKAHKDSTRRNDSFVPVGNLLLFGASLTKVSQFRLCRDRAGVASSCLRGGFALRY